MDNDPNTMLGTLSDNTMDFDLMDELFYDGCWLETTYGSNFSQPGLSISSPSNFSPHYLPSSETNMDLLDPIPYQRSFQETIRSNSGDNPPLIYPQMEELAGSSSQSESFLVEGTEMSRRLWIDPGANLSPTTSMKKRFMQAFEYLKESTRDTEVLIQVWVPIRSEGKRVLTTNDQPFSLNTNCKSLAGYRDVSRSYQFAVEEDSKEFVGLPGRVFLKQLPEWTPDVRFFRRQEYPRIKFAQQYNVSGSLALPVFERGSGTCLGVVEIVTTTQKVNYRPELENICRALEAVDLRSSELLSPPKVKECDESYQAALAEIQEVLKSVCDAHKLPLAQTWAPCTQGKGGCCHSERNNSCCISIVDSACYRPNEELMGFHEACSEHHLIKGEGVAGRALMTNQLCFATDITAFSKTEYPLSHHARMFELHAAVAIRLRSVFTGSADFILEFFLPLNCKDAEEQNRMVSSISLVLQRVSQSLRFITDQELDEDNTQKLLSSPSKEATRDESSWIAHMMEAQRKGKGVAVSLGCHKEEPEEEFKVITHWNNNEIELHDGSTFSELEQNQKNSSPEGRAEGGGDFSSVGRHCPSVARKVVEKRLTKTERTISLQVLRQYFSGSLKDAAKSIGVCPTTLKRICRQHGITRWPSRKIKKVDHSLRKLQRVIESVQGAEGAIQLSSFYTNFPQLSSPNLPHTSPFSTTNTNENLKQLNTQSEGRTLLLSPVTTPSKSPSSSGSHSSSSSFCCSTGAKQLSVSANASGSRDPLSSEQPGGVLKRARSDEELHQSGILFGEHPSLVTLPPLTKSSSQILRGVGAFRVKATFGEEKIRFSMPQNWGFQDLQGEIVSRFIVDDISKMDLKYMDDESEWILLTCDADLEECIDIHRSSRSRTIKLSVHQTSRLNLGSSFGSSGPS